MSEIGLESLQIVDSENEKENNTNKNELIKENKPDDKPISAIESNINIKDKINASNIVNAKNYRIKNSDWYCKPCDIYCNSNMQFEVHLLSQKHKATIEFGDKLKESVDNKDSSVAGVVIVSASSTSTSCSLNNSSLDIHDKQNVDINNNYIENDEFCSSPNKSSRELKTPLSRIDMDNPIATKYQVDAVKYLIPESKKKGKFEKFGFYCPTCDAYMTGQIQLIMHVRGAKHQYFCPNEIPGYKPTKIYNPNSHHAHKKNINSTNKRMMDSYNSGYFNGYTGINKLNNSKLYQHHTSTPNTVNRHLTNGYDLFMNHKQQYNAHHQHQINTSYLNYLMRNESLMHGSNMSNNSDINTPNNPYRIYPNNYFNNIQSQHQTNYISRFSNHYLNTNSSGSSIISPPDPILSYSKSCTPQLQYNSNINSLNNRNLFGPIMNQNTASPQPFQIITTHNQIGSLVVNGNNRYGKINSNSNHTNLNDINNNVGNTNNTNINNNNNSPSQLVSTNSYSSQMNDQFNEFESLMQKSFVHQNSQQQSQQQQQQQQQSQPSFHPFYYATTTPVTPQSQLPNRNSSNNIHAMYINHHTPASVVQQNISSSSKIDKPHYVGNSNMNNGTSSAQISTSNSMSAGISMSLSPPISHASMQSSTNTPSSISFYHPHPAHPHHHHHPVY